MWTCGRVFLWPLVGSPDVGHKYIDAVLRPKADVYFCCQSVVKDVVQSFKAVVGIIMLCGRHCGDSSSVGGVNLAIIYGSCAVGSLGCSYPSVVQC